MKSNQQNISLSSKALYLGVGSVLIIILSLIFIMSGMSDGTVFFVAPFLASPFMAVASIVLAIIALGKRVTPRKLAILGIVSGGVSVILFIGFIIFAIEVASVLQDV